MAYLQKNSIYSGKFQESPKFLLIISTFFDIIKTIVFQICKNEENTDDTRLLGQFSRDN